MHAEILRYAARAGLPAAPFDGCPEPWAAGLRGDWRAAAAGWARVGDPYEQALELAASGEPAPTLEALRTLEDLGAHAAVRHVRRRLRELGITRVPRRPTADTRAHPAGLTRRQADVLALIADGLTNAEIADELVLSVRTVDTHVGAILDRLGVRSRREAASVARTLDLATRPSQNLGSAHRCARHRPRVHCTHDARCRRRPRERGHRLVHRAVRRGSARRAGHAHRRGPGGADPAARWPGVAARHELRARPGRAHRPAGGQGDRGGWLPLRSSTSCPRGWPPACSGTCSTRTRPITAAFSAGRGGVHPPGFDGGHGVLIEQSTHGALDSVTAASVVDHPGTGRASAGTVIGDLLGVPEADFARFRACTRPLVTGEFSAGLDATSRPPSGCSVCCVSWPPAAVRTRRRSVALVAARDG